MEETPSQSKRRLGGGWETLPTSPGLTVWTAPPCLGTCQVPLRSAVEARRAEPDPTEALSTYRFHSQRHLRDDHGLGRS